MSKKHFEYAAKRIRQLREDARDAVARGDVDYGKRLQLEADGASDIIKVLGIETNPRFDLDRFNRACAL